ncbi:uncharacterized protein MELLADRAFT_102866 [Melampsora larici-populina 98AG31]|uniref:Secreted protein n=1 Tax=Melampsora larici-populina (strain 98AG31 / pathotype 3-4-7) TaxID=747676 RepID=F4R9N0_MELLP|nr:uncharacterized protein MELLADRAFT_102866 [Melampsora larici-populina 98AG31]EGG11121.1 hypothetical protein MELLADRAFT_102866 [Melampsora larici-populina 98AG31]
MLKILFIWSTILILHLMEFLNFGPEKYIKECDIVKYQLANNNYQLCVEQWRAIEDYPYAPQGLTLKAKEAKEIAFKELNEEIQNYRHNGILPLDESDNHHPCITPESYSQFIDFKKPNEDHSPPESTSSRHSRNIPILRLKEDGKDVYILESGLVVLVDEWEKTHKYLEPDQPWKLSYNNYQHCLEHWKLIKANPTPPSDLLPKAEAAMEKAWKEYIKVSRRLRDHRNIVSEYGGHVYNDVKHYSSRYWAMLRSVALLTMGRTKKPAQDSKKFVTNQRETKFTTILVHHCDKQANSFWISSGYNPLDRIPA